tara:strand:- start:43 stop:498 length:456 start_codon:yes stop_codon:yes gene_type:complete
MSYFSGKWKVSNKNSSELATILRYSGHGKIAANLIARQNFVVNVSHVIDVNTQEEELYLTIKIAFRKIVKKYPLTNFQRVAVDIHGDSFSESITYNKELKQLLINTTYLEKSLIIKEEWTLVSETRCQHRITVTNPQNEEISTVLLYDKKE